MIRRRAEARLFCSKQLRLWCLSSQQPFCAATKLLCHSAGLAIAFTCTKGFAASARRCTTCALINSICDAIILAALLFCSNGLLNAVKHCWKHNFLHDLILPVAKSAVRKCAHAHELLKKLSDVLKLARGQ